MNIKAEHIIPYLPYSLQTLIELGDAKWLGKVDIYNIGNFIEGNTTQRIILRPIEDIIKPFSHKGEETCCLIECFGLAPNEKNLQFIKTKVEEQRLTYKEMIILIEQHYDVFGLIEAGQAIDQKTFAI